MSMFTAVRETLSGFKSLMIGMRITAREAAKPIITVQYPRETLPMPARFRGHIKLVLDPETGRPRCTACTLCAKACPSNCIDLDGLRREGDKKKSVSKYLLDFTKCSLCGSCVEVCPSDAIDFSKEYNVVGLNRGQFDAMDLYQKIETEAALWAQTHPAPATAISPAPATAASTSAPAVMLAAAPQAPAAAAQATAAAPVAAPAKETSA
jgi:NADH-quinone oxidoreductase subunit I